MRASITQYVMKVHSRCDLACDHCYVYEHADQSWRAKPRAISQATADLAAQRIAEHAAAHGLPEVQIILHGGEPLLLGTDRMRGVLAVLDARITPVASVDLRIHTNGVLLDEQWCALFDEYGVKVGISLDGDRAANDRHRKFRNGQSSHPHVQRALALLRRPEHRHLYAGILCTIDLANDPIAAYEALVAEMPPNLDLLLPHATWDSPPQRPDGVAQPYADWLTRIYRRWVCDGRPVPIRLFDSLISAGQGGPSWSEAIGLDPVDLLVIETDGSWEQADSLKTAFDGAPATGLRVDSHAVDEVVRQRGVAVRQGGLASLSAVCQACPVVRICGGGLYAHRYRAGTGFDNPSVYCADLKALIGQLTVHHAEPAAVAGSRAMHSLPAGAFDALAAGPGDVEAVRSLAQMRLSLTRALVAEVASLNSDWTDGELHKAAAEGWSLLCALDAEQPMAVQEIFAHPYTHAWALRCLRPPEDADRDLDRAHLAGLAAAAALRAGATVELPVPVRDGKLHLPTMGALQVDTGSARTAVISVSPARLAAGDCGGRWHAARRVSGPAFQVALEDLDPFRDCQRWPAADRLSPADWRIWRRELSAAGTRLAAALPAYTKTLGVGLRCVVPLRPGAVGQRSATASQAFGAVALGLPRRPGTVDGLLLHEFQHVKLNALLDLHALFDTADRRRITVPWRDDPRPVEGALHGTYAYLALTHLYRSRGPKWRDLHLRYRSWVCDVIVNLSATGALTGDGERFVAGMHAAAEKRADD